MKQIETKQDIEHLVNSFYTKVLKNETLAPFFKHLNFDLHLPKMVHFWAFALLDEPNYTTNVTEKHLSMPLKKEHFDHWLELFNETVDEMFTGEKAEHAKQRASLIAWTIEHKINSK